MKRHFSILTLFFLSNFAFSEAKFDTLVIGKKKYLLTKTKIFYTSVQNSPVTLPSEYAELANSKTQKFKFKALADSSFEVFVEDKFGGEVTVLKPQAKEFPYRDSIAFLYAFVDTIQLSPSEFLTFKPYIKSSNKKVFFCASKVDRLYNDTITISSQSYITSGFILGFWQPMNSFKEAEISELKRTTFVLRELYYKKGNATFYLDRKFIIKIK